MTGGVLPRRDTRVQLVIVENGRYLLLEHHIKKQDLLVWGLPGGGVEPGETEAEAARREALEETGLSVRLLGKTFERRLEGNPLYRRAVTFPAVPVAGEPKLGTEPEEALKAHYGLTNIRWHDLWDRNLPRFALENTWPILDWIESEEVGKRTTYLWLDDEKGMLLAREAGRLLEARHLKDLDPGRVRKEADAVLNGNLVETEAGCFFERTVVSSRGPFPESGVWVPFGEALGRLENRALFRHLERRIGPKALERN